MAPPLTPSQWTRLRPPANVSIDPAAEAQAKRRREELRRQWREAAAVAPQVRAVKAKIEGELLPAHDREVAEAEAALEAARDRLDIRIVNEEQGGRVITTAGGRVILSHTEEDEANDPDVLAAKARLLAARTGRDWRRRQLTKCDQHLALVDYTRPPED